MICRYAALTLFSLLLSLPFISGCGEDEAPPPEPVEEEGEPLAFETVGQGFRASLQDTVETVIRDPERWAQLSGQFRPGQPFDSVDFDQVMVLLAALPVPAGGYDLRFETVERTDTAVVAQYLFAEPGDDCMAGMGQSVPFQAVAVPRVEGPVRFVRRTGTYRCTIDDGGF